MDPNACLDRFLSALDDQDYEEAEDAYDDLCAWMLKGGFEPDWEEFEQDGVPEVTKEWFMGWSPPDCVDTDIDDFACPGCGCMPGEGITESCNHPDGCGYGKSARA